MTVLSRSLLFAGLALIAFTGVSCSTAGSGRGYQDGYSGQGSSQNPASSWQDEMFRPTN
ncbi:MAG: hypothetical protein HRU46_05500 [Verrucomicrobiales bacterium]|nr:hypothetical protein [Verrucomicrobiales bacterium]